jgi:uncharacterized membrane protein (TIGR02234 family)
MAAAQTAPTAPHGEASTTAPDTEAGGTVTERASVRPARSSARAKSMAALLAAVGAVVILLTIGRGWAHGDVTSPIIFPVTATGSQLTGVPYALGLAGLAGALALFAVRRVGRYLVGAVLALAGAGTVYAVADRLSRLDDALRTQAATKGLSADAKMTHVENTLWPYLTVLGGVLLCAAGIYTLARGRGWSGLGSRYDAPAEAAAAAPKPAKPAAEVTSRDLWDAQGRGSDLTE